MHLAITIWDYNLLESYEGQVPDQGSEGAAQTGQVISTSDLIT